MYAPSREPSTYCGLALLAVLGSIPHALSMEAAGPSLEAADRSEADEGRSRRGAPYAFLPADGGHAARRPDLQLDLFFDGRGSSVQPTEGSWTWGLELRGYGYPGDQDGVESPRRTRVQDNRLVYEWDAVLDEWYVNDSRGLEHGYTIKERPLADEPRDDDRIWLDLAVRGGLQPVVQRDGRGVLFQDTNGRSLIAYSGLVVFDAQERRLESSLVSTRAGLRIVVDAAGACYPITVDPIVQQAYIKASNAQSFDAFGSALSVSADTAVVGAWMEASNATGVNGNQNDNSLFWPGAAYVFVHEGGAWAQEAYLKASNTFQYDSFGRAVSVSGDTIVVGSLGENSGSTGVNGDQTNFDAPNAGAAYVFTRSGSTWMQQAYLKASNTDSEDRFGSAVAIDVDTIVVGAPREDGGSGGVDGDSSDNSQVSAGAAYVFVRNGSTWSQQAYLKASSPDALDEFGLVVAVSGDTVVVGSRTEDSGATGVNGDATDNSMPDSGAAYVFVRNGTTWTQQAYLKASNTDGGDEFGASVAVSGDLVVVGAEYESSAAVGVDGDQSSNAAAASGAAYVFERTATDWSQTAYLKASHGDIGDFFGCSVAVSGDSLLVGAWLEDGAGSGLGADPMDNGASNSGAAYLFVRSGPTWVQRAYLKASNTDPGDFFGLNVALSGSTALIGAHQERSTTTGIDSTPNNAGGQVGAAYAFDLGDPGEPLVYCAPKVSSAGCSASISTSAPDTAPVSGAGGYDVVASGVHSFKNGLLFAGVSGPSNAPFSGGTLCVAPPLKRGPVLGSGGSGPNTCTGSYGIEVNDGQVVPVGLDAGSGNSGWYQWWYRDPQNGSGTLGTALSNAVQLDFL